MNPSGQLRRGFVGLWNSFAESHASLDAHIKKREPDDVCRSSDDCAWPPAPAEDAEAIGQGRMPNENIADEEPKLNDGQFLLGGVCEIGGVDDGSLRICCSSHGRTLCAFHYANSHFVEVGTLASTVSCHESKGSSER